MSKSAKVSEKPVLTIGEALATCDALEREVRNTLPFKIRCILPKISIHGGMISFDDDGDYVSREEAIEALSMLLELLKVPKDKKGK